MLVWENIENIKVCYDGWRWKASQVVRILLLNSMGEDLFEDNGKIMVLGEKLRFLLWRLG